MTALAVEASASRAALASLEREWRELWDRCPDATPFQHPAWLIPFCDRMGPERLEAIVLRAGGHLVGLAPLFVWDDGKDRVVSLLGGGVSDYLDVLFDPAVADACSKALSVYLDARAERWDRCELEPLRETSPLIRMRTPTGCQSTCAAEDACPVLRLPRALDGLGSVVPKETLRNVRRAKARAEEIGQLELVTADGASRAEILEALFALHARRWEAREEAGVLASDAVRAFHHDVSANFLAAGALRLHAVTLSGRIVAVLYGFSVHGMSTFYLQGFDPEYERCSPGALVVAHAVDEAVRAGDREADFLRGRERYKYLWGAADRPTFRLTIRRRQ